MTLEIGSPAPDFSLKGTDNQTHSLASFQAAKALCVMFSCNHCPYVKHVAAELARLDRDLRTRGLAMVGINSNDADAYPDDSPAKMRDEVARRGYEFPYLFDADQSVARAYRAACTPDFFLFDEHRRLVYRGQLDDSRPGNGVAVTGRDLRNSRPTLDENSRPAVNFSLNNEGANKFGTFTQTNINRQLAVVLDNRVYSAPTINSRIDNDGIIQGSFTNQEVADLALVLRSGALPATLTYLEERTVGPTLGAESIRAGVTAAIGGLVFVMLFILVYYRLAGGRRDAEAEPAPA